MRTYEYRGFRAVVDIEPESGLLVASLLEAKIRAITYRTLVKKIEDAIDLHYENIDHPIEEKGKFSGKFMFRTTSEKHAKIVRAARLSNSKSINAWMNDTIAKELDKLQIKL